MQLFELVADVPRYPEFLPWCHAGRIRRREEPNVQIAELAIGFGPFHEKFASRVVLAPDAPGGPRIDTTGIEGPFRRLVSRWVFHPHPEGCLIDFELEFDFRSILLQQTVRLLHFAGEFRGGILRDSGSGEAETGEHDNRKAGRQDVH